MMIYAQNKQIASWDELHKAFINNQLQDLKAQGRLPTTLSLEELTATLYKYYDTLSRKKAAQNMHPTRGKFTHQKRKRISKNTPTPFLSTPHPPTTL